MTVRPRSVCVTVLLAALTTVWPVNLNAAPERKAGGKPAAAALETVEAFLFHSSAGAISQRNLAFEKSPENVPIELVEAPSGENSDKGPSSSILVIVALRGEPRSIQQDGLVLRVYAETRSEAALHPAVRPLARLQKGIAGRQLLRSSAEGNALLPSSGRESHHVPFVVHGTGCVPVLISAELVRPNGTVIGRVERIVPFVCSD